MTERHRGRQVPLPVAFGLESLGALVDNAWPAFFPILINGKSQI